MRWPRHRSRRAFTIIEVMIAIFLFGVIIFAIYAAWLAVLRGSRAGLKAAAEVQRSRIAMRTIEDALVTSQLFVQNIYYYAFVADTSGELAGMTMVSRLPASFPGVGRYGDQIVRRVSFMVQPGAQGNELVMTQAPMLVDTNSTFEPYSLVLARDVTRFTLEFYNAQKEEWEEEWKYTNALPALVMVTLGLGKKGDSQHPHDEMAKLIALPAAAVTGDIQAQRQPGMDQPVPPGGPTPNPGTPGGGFPNPGTPGGGGFPNPGTPRGGGFRNPGR